MLNKMWRILATASAFILFGIGGLLLSLIFFPILRLLYRGKNQVRRTKARRFVHHGFKAFIGYMQWVGICDVIIENVELLKSTKGKLVIANHPSLIDVVVLISLIENADCVVKAGLWKNPFLKGVVSNTGYINNEEDPDTFITECKKSFAQGNNLVVFPEGTRTSAEEKLVFRRGAANIAIRAKVDLLPIMISITPTTLTKELAWYQIPDKKFIVKLVVKPEIEIEDYVQQEVVSTSVRQLTRKLLEYYNKELNFNE